MILYHIILLAIYSQYCTKLNCISHYLMLYYAILYYIILSYFILNFIL